MPLKLKTTTCRLFAESWQAIVLRSSSSCVCTIRRSFAPPVPSSADEADAEDVLQDAYLAALRHMGDFRGESRLATWLTRIVINKALGRLRSRRRDNVIELLDDRAAGRRSWTGSWARIGHVSGDRARCARNCASFSSTRSTRLPLAYRTAFILREVEELTIEEAAECLAIPASTVRTRVFRARALLRASLAEEMDIAATDVFRFDGARCDRIVANVLDRLRVLDAAASRRPPP